MTLSLPTWHRLARRASCWLLALLLLATLAPAVSRALGKGPAEAGAGDRWAPLCTSEGMQWVQVDPGLSGDDMPSPEALDLCGFCTLAAERFAPLIPEPPALPVLAGSWPVPSFVAASGGSAPVRAALARGPPLPV